MIQRSLGPLGFKRVLADEPSGHGDQWVPALVRCRGIDFVFIAVYMEDGVGPQGNMHRLQQLANFVSSLKVPWIILGDWNMEPETLEGIGWLSLIKGKVATPAGTTFTCTSGSGRLLDYAVVKANCRELVELGIDGQGVWSPHMGVTCSLRVEVDKVWVTSVVRALPIPKAHGPVGSSWRDRCESFRCSATVRDNGGWNGLKDAELSSDFACFSMAVEAVQTERAGLAGDDRYTGRGGAWLWCAGVRRALPAQGPILSTGLGSSGGLALPGQRSCSGPGEAEGPSGGSDCYHRLAGRFSGQEGQFSS